LRIKAPPDIRFSVRVEVFALRTFERFTLTKEGQPGDSRFVGTPACAPEASMVKEAAEKLKKPPFRGTLRAEESLLFLDLERRGIPRFARNDEISLFPAACKTLLPAAFFAAAAAPTSRGLRLQR
jgi:hypothetical protein